jgi:hypothetical protein
MGLLSTPQWLRTRSSHCAGVSRRVVARDEHPLVSLDPRASLDLHVLDREEGLGVRPDRLARRLAVAVGPARVCAEEPGRANHRRAVVEDVLGAGDDGLHGEQLGGEFQHRSLLVLEREEVVLSRGHHGIGVGAREAAGVVGDDIEERAVGLDEALERSPEPGDLVCARGDGGRVDARPPRRRDQRAGHRADDAEGHRLPLDVILHEGVVQRRQRRRLTVERDDAHGEPHRIERLPAPRRAHDPVQHGAQKPKP